MWAVKLRGKVRARETVSIRTVRNPMEVGTRTIKLPRLQVPGQLVRGKTMDGLPVQSTVMDCQKANKLSLVRGPTKRPMVREPAGTSLLPGQTKAV